MSRYPPAVHRTIAVFDVDKFSDPARTNLDQLAVRDGMYKALTQSFARARIDWATCTAEDRGDGALVLVPPEVPKNLLVTRLPGLLAAELARHNTASTAPTRIRLRMALHAGEIHQDEHGVTGTSINHTFRLIEAPAFKAAFGETAAVLAVIVSSWFYDEVVRHDPAARPSSFRDIDVAVKETQATARIRLLGATGETARVPAGGAIRAPHSAINRPVLARASVTPQVTDLRRFYAVSEDARHANVLALAAWAKDLCWWHDYRDVVPGWFETYLSLEPAARLIRGYETHFVPGLLQTEEYAHAVIRHGHVGAPAAELRRRVDLRMRRQQILRRPDPARLWAIIDEAAFRRWPGSAATMRRQIRCLIDISERPNVTIQVMPVSVDGYAVAGGSITLLRSPGREFPDVVYLEQLTSALYLGKPDDIHHYSKVLNRLGIEAEEPAATAGIFHRILTET